MSMSGSSGNESGRTEERVQLRVTGSERLLTKNMPVLADLRDSICYTVFRNSNFSTVILLYFPCYKLKALLRKFC